MKIKDITGSRLRGVLLGTTLLVGAAATFAFAQAQRGPQDPASMPEFRGKVMQYSLSPRGDVDGLILVDGTEIHVPPHLGTQVQAAVRPGDEVTVRGVREEGPVVRAGSVTGVASGRTVVDAGPRGPGPVPAGQAMEETGVVRMAVHGPRGEVNGVVLQNGTILRLPPEEAQRLAAALAPGATVAVRGTGVANDAGRVIEVREMGPEMGKLSALAVPPPPPAPPPGPVGAPPPPPPGAPAAGPAATPPPAR